jgi:hypothetical protein
VQNGTKYGLCGSCFEGASSISGECNEEFGDVDAELSIIGISGFGGWTRSCGNGLELEGRDNCGSLILQEAIWPLIPGGVSARGSCRAVTCI